MDSFVPEVVEKGYAIMLVGVAGCPICKKVMVHPPSGRPWNDTFPHYHKINFEAQLKAAGWEEQSHNGTEDHNYICKACEEKGLATFQCAMCETSRTTDSIQEFFGDPPSLLCKVCYSTVTAEVWAKKVKELEKEHRWDFE